MKSFLSVKAVQDIRIPCYLFGNLGKVSLDHYSMIIAHGLEYTYVRRPVSSRRTISVSNFLQ